MAASDHISDAQMREILEQHAERTRVRLHENGDVTLPNNQRVPAMQHQLHAGRDIYGFSHIYNEKGAHIGVHTMQTADRHGEQSYSRIWHASDDSTVVPPRMSLNGTPDSDVNDVVKAHLEQEPTRPLRDTKEELRDAFTKRHLLEVLSTGKPVRHFNLRTGTFED